MLLYFAAIAVAIIPRTILFAIVLYSQSACLDEPRTKAGLLLGFFVAPCTTVGCLFAYLHGGQTPLHLSGYYMIPVCSGVVLDLIAIFGYGPKRK